MVYKEEIWSQTITLPMSFAEYMLTPSLSVSPRTLYSLPVGELKVICLYSSNKQ